MATTTTKEPAMQTPARQRQFRVIPATQSCTTGVASAARQVPASLVVAGRDDIRASIEALEVGAVTTFEARWDHSTDLGGHSAVTVERVA